LFNNTSAVSHQKAIKKRGEEKIEKAISPITAQIKFPLDSLLVAFQNKI
jgi:hypothetical protein